MTHSVRPAMRRALVSAVLLAMCVTPADAWAATYTWNVTTGTWTDSLAWAPTTSASGTGPVAADTIVYAGATSQTMDLAGATQTVATLTTNPLSATPLTLTATNGSLLINGITGNLNLFATSAVSGRLTYDFAGLSAFTYNAPTRNVGVGWDIGTATGTTTLNLATEGSGSNSITAATFHTASVGNTNVTGLAVVNLGKLNTFNVANFNIGTFTNSGTVAFGSGVAGGSLVLRGTAGGAARVDGVIIGQNSSGNGNRFGSGWLNLTGGTVDARVTTTTIGSSIAGGNVSSIGVLTMAGGVYDTLTMVLGAESAGSSSLTATVNHNGGLMLTETLRFGDVPATTNAAAPTFTSIYNLASGTLRAGLITSQPSVPLSGTTTANAASIRRIAWSGGTIANYDASTDLVISGTTTNAGYTMQIVLGSTSTPQVFSVDSGRTITVGPEAVISGTGALQKTGAGTVVLGASNTFVGQATISAGTLQLSGGDNRLPTAGTMLMNGSGSLNLGGNAQALANFTATTNATAGVINASVSNGSLTVNGAGDFSVTNTTTTTGTLTVNMSGLASLTINKNANLLVQGATYNTADQDQVLVLSATSNSITVNTVSVGSQAAASAVASGVLQLGALNTLYADAFNIGKIARSSGVIEFQSGLPGTPAVTIRNKSGTGRANVYLSEQWGGASTSTGILDFSRGSVDALLGTVEVGRAQANATTGMGVITMGTAGGTIDATTVTLAYAYSNSIGVASGTFTQNGSTSLVKIDSLVMGNSTSSGTTTLNATYNLVSGTLVARSIASGSGSGVFAAGSNRKIDWTAGTMRNYDASTDLTINGQSGTGGNLTINLLTAATHTFQVDAGRTITLGDASTLAGAGAVTKAGDGSLVVNGSNTFSGGINLNAGTLMLGNAAAIGTSGTISFGGGTLQYSANNATDYSGRFSTSAGQQYRIDTGSANVTLASGLTSSGGSLAKLGSGTLTLGGANTYGGSTLVDAGTLKLGAGGSIAASTLIKVSAGAIYDVMGVTGYALESGQTLGGVGTVVGDMIVASGATLSPGNSPGTLLQTGDETWGGGGNYNWQLYDSGSTAIRGTGWDFLDVTGALSITATGLNPFNINLWTLSGTSPDVNGAAINFNGSYDYAWDFATFSEGISGFDAVAFRVVTSATNGTGGFLNGDATGVFSVRLKPGDATTLQIVYAAVPEPSTFALAGLGVVTVAVLMRRRRTRVSG